MTEAPSQPKRRRKRKNRFFLEVRTDQGWRQVSTFDRSDQARANLGQVGTMMPHLLLRVSKDFRSQFKAIAAARLRAAVGKYVAVCITIAILVALVLAQWNA